MYSKLIKAACLLLLAGTISVSFVACKDKEEKKEEATEAPAPAPAPVVIDSTQMDSDTADTRPVKTPD